MFGAWATYVVRPSIKEEQMNEKYLLGSNRDEWMVGETAQLTFVVTQECNLRCKYCYMTGKNDAHKMTFQVAKDAIDFFLEYHADFFDKDYIILDFIGGEPLLEIDLIDEIVDYFKYVTFKKNHPWFSGYKINIATNGLLYSSPKVQHFIAKNKENLSIGISIDGMKEKHDLQRVYPDGRGSYEDVEKNVRLWVKQFPHASTKVTVGHDDLKYVKDSIIHLWNLGIRDVPANVVFEDVWEEGDDQIWQEQLFSLADYILENHLWDRVNTSLFYEQLGFRQGEDEINKNFCGTGKSFAIDAEGNLYPCVRYLDYSLNEKKAISFGNIYTGVDEEKLRPFRILTTKNQSPKECLECPVSTGCSYCQAHNYDASEMDTNFERAKANCKMHKAQVRAANYYWAKLYNRYGIDRFEGKGYRKYPDRMLYVIMGDDSVRICENMKDDVDCGNRNEKTESLDMVGKSELTKQVLLNALESAGENFFQPYLMHRKNVRDERELLSNPLIKEKMEGIVCRHLYEYSRENCQELLHYFREEDLFPVFNRENYTLAANEKFQNVLLIVKEKELEDLYDMVTTLGTNCSRINLKAEVNSRKTLSVYEKQLEKLIPYIAKRLGEGKPLEISVLTDRLFLSAMEDNCYAGEKNLAFGPDGKFYLCPEEYFEEKCDENYYENYDEKETGVRLNRVRVMEEYLRDFKMTKLEMSPTCTYCDAYQCQRCVYLNKKRTGEYNVPSSIQCFKSGAEHRLTIELKNLLEQKYEMKGFDEIVQWETEEPFQERLQMWGLVEA